MSTIIGIDIAKNFLDTYNLSNNKSNRYSNDLAGINKLFEDIKDQDCSIFAESTGVYQTLLIKSAWKNDVRIAIVNPLRVRQFARSTGRLAKNDKLDAKMIALFAQTTNPRFLMKKDDNILLMEDLLRLRRHLLESSLNSKNHKEAQTSAQVTDLLQPVFVTLQEQQKSVESKIMGIINNCEVLTTIYSKQLLALGILPLGTC